MRSAHQATVTDIAPGLIEQIPDKSPLPEVIRKVEVFGVPGAQGNGFVPVSDNYRVADKPLVAPLPKEIAAFPLDCR